MKFTLNWLKDHLETDASLHEIIEALNRVGLEVSFFKEIRSGCTKKRPSYQTSSDWLNWITVNYFSCQ